MTRWGAYRGFRKANKYGNTPKRCREGVFHHSTKESRRCDELHLMQAGGLIKELQAHPQPKFDLSVGGIHVADYMADFQYVDAETGETVVEDVKGMRTDIYRLKARLMMGCHNIEIKET